MYINKDIYITCLHSLAWYLRGGWQTTVFFAPTSQTEQRCDGRAQRGGNTLGGAVTWPT